MSIASICKASARGTYTGVFQIFNDESVSVSYSITAFPSNGVGNSASSSGSLTSLNTLTSNLMGYYNQFSFYDGVVHRNGAIMTYGSGVSVGDFPVCTTQNMCSYPSYVAPSGTTYKITMYNAGLSGYTVYKMNAGLTYDLQAINTYTGYSQFTVDKNDFIVFSIGTIEKRIKFLAAGNYYNEDIDPCPSLYVPQL